MKNKQCIFTLQSVWNDFVFQKYKFKYPLSATKSCVFYSQYICSVEVDKGRYWEVKRAKRVRKKYWRHLWMAPLAQPARERVFRPRWIAFLWNLNLWFASLLRVLWVSCQKLSGPAWICRCHLQYISLQWKINSTQERKNAVKTGMHHSIYIMTVSSKHLLYTLLNQLKLVYGPFGQSKNCN